MGRSLKAAYTKDDAGSIKEIGRYTSATVEYTSLVALSVLQRGGDTAAKGAKFVLDPVQKGIQAVVDPLQKGGRAIKDGAAIAVAPIKKIGNPAKKIIIPFTWTASKIGRVLSRGFPVHLDPTTVDSLETSLARIERRLAHLEEKGIYLAGGAPMRPPTADNFKEKPDEKKSLVLRAVLEDSMLTLAEK